MRLVINGREVEVASVADVRPYWDAVRQHQFSEVWLRAADEGQALAMLVNQQDAWLIYLGQDEDNLSYHPALRAVSTAHSP
jgi:hypothetical protein